MPPMRYTTATQKILHSSPYTDTQSEVRVEQDTGCSKKWDCLNKDMNNPDRLSNLGVNGKGKLERTG